MGTMVANDTTKTKEQGEDDWKWVTGDIISIKDKIDKRGRSFVGITIKERTQVLFWFRMSPDEFQACDVTLAHNFPVEVLGRVTGRTDDGTLTFLGDVKVISPRTEDDAIREIADAHVEQVEEKNAERERAQAVRKVNEQIAVEMGPAIKDGTYTVVFNDDEADYETVRVRMNQEWCDGKTVVEFLNGPDNEWNFKGFGFLIGTDVRVWSRFKDGSEAIARKVKAIETLATQDEEGQRSAGEAYAMRSERCCRCGKELTVPASLHRGMGPVCAERGF